MASDSGSSGWRAAGPLSPTELEEVLRTSQSLLRADRGHDVFTLLDVLAEDHFPGLGREASYQLARTILACIAGIGASETNEPVQALHLWDRRNVEPGKPETPLLWAVSETIKQLAGPPVLQPMPAARELAEKPDALA